MRLSQGPLVQRRPWSLPTAVLTVALVVISPALSPDRVLFGILEGNLSRFPIYGSSHRLPVSTRTHRDGASSLGYNLIFLFMFLLNSLLRWPLGFSRSAPVPSERPVSLSSHPFLRAFAVSGPTKCLRLILCLLPSG